MQTLRTSQTDDIHGIIQKAKRKFGKDKKFAFAIWPLDGSLRLIIKGGNYEGT